MRYALLGAAILIGACASKSKCGNPEGARVVYMKDGQSCIARIRQVTVGSELRIPQSMKEKLGTVRLGWKEAEMRDGAIETGHFIFLPETGKGSGR